MKKIFLIITALIVLSSCEDNSSNNNTSEKKITATVNGNSFKAQNIILAVEYGTYRRQLRIYGESGETKIELLLKFEPMDTIRTGNYTLTKYGEFLAIYYHGSVADTATEGIVKLDKFIDSEPPTAKGTFNFLVKQNNSVLYNISNGFFDSGK